VVDPYYQWNLNQEDFNNYLVKKYGSIENAQETIVYYRNNWYDDDNVLTPEFYNNTLQETWKQYYAPFYANTNTRILYWKRAELDWTMETNEIWKGTVANNSYVAGDRVIMGDLTSSPAIIVDTTTFNGTIAAVDDDDIYIQHVTYSTDPANLVSISLANNINVVGIANVELVYRAIPLDEGVFWSQVTAFDIENELNTYNRSVKVLESTQLFNVLSQIDAKLTE
jgi:hypothetical protein